MKPFVYVAGPLTLGDTVLNIRNAMAAGNAIRAMGAYPYVPHYNVMRHFLEEHAPDWWMEEDFAWLSVCHALYRESGASVGADREVAEAKRLCKRVFYDLAELKLWVEAWPQTRICEEA